MQRRWIKIWFLGSIDGLAPLGVKSLIFIHEKSTHLSILKEFFANIQQGLLVTGHMSPSNWWSAWPYCLGQLFLKRGHVSDTCNAAMTAATRPCQLLSIPASCNRTKCDLPVVIVQWTCLAHSFNTIGRWAIRTGSRPGLPTSNLVGGLVVDPVACQRGSSRDGCFLFRSARSQVDLTGIIKRRLLGNKTWSDIS